jgi:hypothetical protein
MFGIYIVDISGEGLAPTFLAAYKDEYAVETWSFDMNKFDKGPIQVDIKYKAGAEKAIKLNAKQSKQDKKAARQMKKINERNK